MKTKNFNLLFYLKKVKGEESGNLPIYLHISVVSEIKMFRF